MLLARSILNQKLLLDLNKMEQSVSYSSLIPGFISGLVIGVSGAYVFFKRRKDSSNNVDDVLQKYHEENFEFPDPGDEYRLVMCIRHDLKMQKGKVAAQCGHAAVAAYVKGMRQAPKMIERWMTFGGTKITLKVDSETELFELEKRAKRLDLLTNVVRDAGQTQVEPGARTVIAIGPAPQTLLDQVTGHLKLY